MVNKIFLLGLFLLSVANVKAQTLTHTDSLTMENMMHNLPEVMVKGSRPIVKAERGMLSYNMPLLLKQLPADNAYEALTRIPGISDATGSISFSGNGVPTGGGFRGSGQSGNLSSAGTSFLGLF